jgi:hypothetical protein
MPDFDGNVPLKRGQIIGRGPCRQTSPECPLRFIHLKRVVVPVFMISGRCPGAGLSGA